MQSFRVISAFLIAVTLTGEILVAGESAEAMMAQAIELLQKNEKQKALKLLEQTFEKAVDPEQVKEAAVLILAASPENYSKRESYLRYLTQRYRTHEDVWKWFKELGDRAYSARNFNDAEEAYLNAQTQAPDPSVVKYKLAWVYWNQNRRNEALSLLLDLNAKSADSTQIQDVAHLWWELGPMPEATYAKFLILEETTRSAIVSELLGSFPTDQLPKPHTIEMLKQIRDNDLSRSVWTEILARDLYFKKDPCFFIASLLGPSDFASRQSLIACTKDPAHPPIADLERHFSHLMFDADESLVQSYANLLQEADQNAKAAIVMMNWPNFDTAEKTYHSSLYALSVSLSNDELSSLYSTTTAERWQKILSATKDTALLRRLQELEPQKWIEYEEGLYAGKTIPRALQLKKLKLLSQNYVGNKSEIESTVHSMLEKPSTPEEKALKKMLSGVEKSATTELSATFDDKFTKQLYLWVSTIDKNVAVYQKLSEDWKALAGPLFVDQLTANLNQVRDQIDRALPPEGSTEMEPEFLSRKADVRDKLLAKYEDILKPSL